MGESIHKDHSKAQRRHLEQELLRLHTSHPTIGCLAAIALDEFDAVNIPKPRGEIPNAPI